VRTEAVGLDGAFSQAFTVDAADTVAIRVEEVLVDSRVEAAAFTVQDAAFALDTTVRDPPTKALRAREGLIEEKFFNIHSP
jgi:hypothetical protein